MQPISGTPSGEVALGITIEAAAIFERIGGVNVSRNLSIRKLALVMFLAGTAFCLLALYLTSSVV
jgi:hypothetical protein